MRQTDGASHLGDICQQVGTISKRFGPALFSGRQSCLNCDISRNCTHENFSFICYFSIEVFAV